MKSGDSCSFCKIELNNKCFIVDHIDGNPENNKLENLRLNCPACERIRHCGLVSTKRELEIWVSKLSQIEIVKITHDFFLENKYVPTPQQIDENAKKTSQFPFEISQLYFSNKNSKKKASLRNDSKFFFTEEMDFSYLNFKIWKYGESAEGERERVISTKASEEEQELIKDLNEQQRLAVLCQNQKICVIAGPGCGKTKTLITRIIFLIKQKNSPKRILVLTFSRKAIKEIRKRIKENISESSDDLNIFNLHGFCYSFLRKNIQWLGIRRDFQICDQNQQTDLIKQILKEKLNLAKYNDSKEISRISNEIVSSKIKSIKNFGIIDFGEMDQVCKKVSIYYHNYLEDNEILDFADLLIKTFLILNQSKFIRERTRAEFAHILIDEFQDINNIQWEIINLISSKNSNLFLVGDPNQSIYGFQGSSPDLIRSLQQQKEWVSIYLNINYRSTKQIINFGNLFIKKHSVNMIQNLLQKTRGDGTQVIFAVKAETDEIVKKIKCFEENGISYNEIAIIYRNNYLSRMIEQSLIRAKIPYEILGSFKFIEREEIKDVLAYIRMIIYNDDLATIRVLSLVERVGETTIRILERNAKEQNLNILSFLCEKFSINSENFFSKKINCKQFENIVKFTEIASFQQKKIESCESVEQFLDQVLLAFQYYEYLQGKKEERILNVKQLFNMLRNWENQNYTNEKEISKRSTEFLNYLAISFEDSQLRKTKNNIILSTVHQVKGLEFKVVFFIHLDHDIIPDKRSVNSLSEEERIFYVGITRAQDYLYLVSSGNIPSTFLNDLELKVSKEFSNEENILNSMSILESIEEDETMEIKNKEEMLLIERKGIVIKNSGLLRDKRKFSYCIVNVITKDGEEKIFCWKKNLSIDKWTLAINLENGNQIKYQGMIWSGGCNITKLKEIKEKAVWLTIKRDLVDLKIAFLDIKTAYSWKTGNEIVEISYAICENSQLILENLLLIKPNNLDLLKEINICNNVKIKELVVAPSWLEVLPQIQRDLANAVIISHNLKSFNYHLLRKGGFFQKNLTYYFFDTLPLSKLLMKEKKWAGRNDLYNLISKIREDKNFQKKHHVLHDSFLHWELFNYLMKGRKEIDLLYRNSLMMN